MKGKNPLVWKAWSPYGVGALIGVLSWFAFASAQKPIGITTAFEYTSALLSQGVAGSSAPPQVYLAEKQKEGKSPKIDWEWMLVLGVFLGAYLSSKLSGDRTSERVPVLWQARFGPKVGPRYLAAFFGGALMMFGARLAQGCTSGHGISGALQLALSSWIFMPLIFLTGAITAYLIYRKEESRYV